MKNIRFRRAKEKQNDIPHRFSEFSRPNVNYSFDFQFLLSENEPNVSYSSTAISTSKKEIK